MLKLLKSNRAVVSFAIMLLVVLVFIVLMFSLLIPMALKFQTQIYEAGEPLIADANSTAANIDDNEMRASIQGALGSAGEAYEGNTYIMSTFVQYFWLIPIVIVLLVAFLYTRKTVEYGGGFR